MAVVDRLVPASSNSYDAIPALEASPTRIVDYVRLSGCGSRTAAPSRTPRNRWQRQAPRGPRLTASDTVGRLRTPPAPTQCAPRTEGSRSGKARSAAERRRGRRRNESGLRFASRSLPLAPRREVRAQDELAVEAAGFETAVRLWNLVEGDPLGDARSDGASCQQPEQALQVLAKPGGMSRPHQIDRIDVEALAAGQPIEHLPREIRARHP